MTINNPDLYNEAWDWSILDGCFGESRIKPTDVDGLTDGDNEVVTVQGAVEHRGCFLWLETKRPGTSLPLGQKLMMQELAKRGDCVIFLWGEKNVPRKMLMLWRGREFDWDTNLEHLRMIVSRWYAHVHAYGTDRAVENG